MQGLTTLFRREYRIPAADLAEFNDNVFSVIEIVAEYGGVGHKRARCSKLSRAGVAAPHYLGWAKGASLALVAFK
jgi:hypothetical protein